MNADKTQQSKQTKPKQISLVTVSVVSIILSLLSAAFLIVLHTYYYTPGANGFVGLETFANGVPYRLILYVAFPFIIFLLTVGAAIYSQYETSGTTNIATAFLGSLNMLKYLYIALAASYFTIFRAPVVAAAPFIITPEKIKGIEDVQTIENNNPSIKGVGIAYYVFFGILLGTISSLGSSMIVASNT
jgi:hypothetical protein